ncbi:protein of unknown function [Moritella yayanosii]|uniref:Uncharacterized protein n=1 Tax=Moritella yayanosii TaxID=69539 RepID=A0A330LNH1_9GAMM|nr:protein of unknown function [Moritella yayanosii]
MWRLFSTSTMLAKSTFNKVCDYLPQHFLNFLPLPHVQGSLRPTLALSLTIGACA